MKFARQCRVAVSIVPKPLTRRYLFSRAATEQRLSLFFRIIPGMTRRFSDPLERDAIDAFKLLYIVLLIYANRLLDVRGRVVPVE